jgi:hypothetical protein
MKGLDDPWFWIRRRAFRDPLLDKETDMVNGGQSIQ